MGARPAATAAPCLLDSVKAGQQAEYRIEPIDAPALPREAARD